MSDSVCPELVNTLHLVAFIHFESFPAAVAARGVENNIHDSVVILLVISFNANSVSCTIYYYGINGKSRLVKSPTRPSGNVLVKILPDGAV